jgi:nicotinamide-nucleotide amidase
VLSTILTIGDELLIGQIINTNQAFIGERLNSIGIDVLEMVTVGDDMTVILNAFRRAWDATEAVIVTGGLGPTHDDITKKAIAEFFGTELVSDPALRRHLETVMAKRGLPWTTAAEDQTLLPRGAATFPNPVGTAAGIRMSRDGKQMFVLPGVPYEMKEMIDQSVIPFLTPLAGGAAIAHRTLRTTGIPESFLAQQLGNLDEILQGSKLAFLPSAGAVRMRITVHAPSADEARTRADQVELRIRAKVGKHIYGTGEQELEDALGALLLERKLTIAVAESCTGGLVAHRLTNVSGSSGYFERGVVTYSNPSKTDLLGVPEGLITSHGAVSKEVATAMAEGIRRAARTDIGLSTTGIAGPTGGTPEKPVGLVYVGYADASGSLAMKFTFGEGRARVKERASQAAMELVRRKLLHL